MSRRFKQEDSNIDREFQEVDKRLNRVEGLDNVPIGGMFLWSGAAPPDDYLWCDGQSYSTLTYPELYKILERRGGTPSPNVEDNFMVPSLTVGSFNFVIRAR